jgi:hypothetical protein
METIHIETKTLDIDLATNLLKDSGFFVGNLTDKGIIHYFINNYLRKRCEIQEKDILWTSDKNAAGDALQVGFKVQGKESVKGGYSAYIFLDKKRAENSFLL